MAVDIRISRRVVAAVGIIETPTARRRVVIDWGTTTRWRTITTTVVIILVAAGWGWASIAVSTIAAKARAVATRFSTTITARLVASTWTWGAGTSPVVTRDVGLGLLSLVSRTS